MKKTANIPTKPTISEDTSETTLNRAFYTPPHSLNAFINNGYRAASVLLINSAFQPIVASFGTKIKIVNKFINLLFSIKTRAQILSQNPNLYPKNTLLYSCKNGKYNCICHFYNRICSSYNRICSSYDGICSLYDRICTSYNRIRSLYNRICTFYNPIRHSLGCINVFYGRITPKSGCITSKTGCIIGHIYPIYLQNNEFQ